MLVYKKRGSFKKVLLTGVVSGAIGICCCGYNPYITNFIEKQDVFYGLVPSHDNIRNNLTPPLFKPLNRFEKLFFSISAHQGWNWNKTDKSSIWDVPKIPFTFNKEDILRAKDPEQELSAFGPFFSGVLIVAVALFVLTVLYFRRVPSFPLFLAVLFILLLSILVIPESWWGRYVPQLWILPIIILLMGEFISFGWARLLRVILYFSLGLNIAWASLCIASNLSTTLLINYQLKQLKALVQPVNIEFCPFNTFKCNQIRFLEAGIPINERSLKGPFVYNVVESNTRFETTVPLPDLPMPFMLKLDLKISGNGKSMVLK
jgi:hypothetical protein